MMRILRELMKLTDADLESEIFRQRIAPFLAAGTRGQQMAVRAGAQTHIIPRRTAGSGHFNATLQIPAAEVAQFPEQSPAQRGWLPLEITAQKLQVQAVGQAQLIPATGLSVISDIDDTIKHTMVAERKELLSNTFLRDFSAIEGMPELYRAWADRGAAFHYVSSSPWQLYEPLAELYQRDQLPAGAFHLRAIRLGDPTVLRLFLARRWGKQRVIRSIVAAFPFRRFVLVGDSGEVDPEIYGAIARRFPGRIARIFIRRTAMRRPATKDRYPKAFRRLPRELWTEFEHPAEITDLLPSIDPPLPDRPLPE